MVDTYGIGLRRGVGGLVAAALLLVAVLAVAACTGAEASRTTPPIIGPPPAAAGVIDIADASGDLARVSLELVGPRGSAVPTLAVESPPALYPQLIVVTAAPLARLTERATLTLPYNDDLVRHWQIADETQLGVFERNAEGTWHWSPALVNPATNTVVLQVEALATWTVGPSWMMTPWQDRSILGAKFVAGERNALVLHGWNGEPWGACQLELMAGISTTYDNVAAVAYPSAMSIVDNANWLRSEIEQWSTGPFDIVAFSEGGLVARAAIEPQAWNGDLPTKARIGRLVTIATPHLGVTGGMGRSLLNDTAALQMRAGSDFLRELNADGQHDRIRYQFIAGDLGWGSDSLVQVDSALGRGAVEAEHAGVLPLAHSPTSDLPRGMPCDPSAYETILEWR